MYLADKSAYEQQRHSPLANEALVALARDGQLAMCDVVALELLYSTRGPEDYAVRKEALRSLPWLPTTTRVGEIALATQERLAAQGHHRRPIPDLLIAATAQVHGATVLHYDKDFDIIAKVTGQPTQWIVPRGTGYA